MERAGAKAARSTSPSSSKRSSATSPRSSSSATSPRSSSKTRTTNKTRASSPAPRSPKKHAAEATATAATTTAAAVAADHATTAGHDGTPERRRRGHEFRPRQSHFDREHFHLDRRSDLHGFLNLVTIATLFYLVVTVLRAYRSDMTFHIDLLATMSKDLVVLGLADLALILFTFTAFFLQVAIARRWIGGVLVPLLQHLLQAALFALAALFIYARDWPWVQSGSLMMHAIILFMKMHSYTATNRELAANPAVHGTVQYPANVTFGNFIDFLLVPTLVYEAEYPRTDRVRPAYLFEKAMMLAGAMSLLFLTVSHYIYPVLDNLPTMSLIESVLTLVFPFLLAYLLIFYIIFECICNFMAEATRFADREFYEDWWNSSSFDEFSRKWNRPVHEFLLRHIYLETMVTYKASRLNATAATLLFSLLLHEMALTVAGRMFRPYILVMATFQLPLMPLMRHPMVKNSRFGNYFFWLGMLVGIPMLAVLYAREHYGLAPLDVGTLSTFLGTCVAFVGILFLINVIVNRLSRHKAQGAAAGAAAAPHKPTTAASGTSAISAAQPVLVQ